MSKFVWISQGLTAGRRERVSYYINPEGRIFLRYLLDVVQ